MQLISLEQLEILMAVAGSDEPVQSAIQMRRRWRYILGVAKAAQLGHMLDASLPQVIRECDSYVRRAEAIIDVLNEWLEEKTGLSASDLN